MLIVAFIAGTLLGWIIALAADVLPRFATAGDPRQTILRPASLPLFWSGLLRVFTRRGPFLESGQQLGLMLEMLCGLGLAVLVSVATLDLALVWTIGWAAFFIIVALIDFRYRLVLNVMTYPAILIALIAAIANPDSLRSVLLGGGFAFAVFFAVAWIRPGDLGGGDVKLAALMGLLFGFPGVLLPLILGGSLGALTAVALMLRGQGRSATMPYAPFLCTGALVALMVQLPTMIG